MEYLELFQQLHKQNIRYLICGGLAVNIYGIPRMIADIDILLDFEEVNVTKFENSMKLLSYISTVSVSLQTMIDKSAREKIIKEKSMIASSFYNSRSGVMNPDVLIDVPFSFDVMCEKREIRKQDTIEINLVSLEHLIEMKTYSNRKQDTDDVLLLSKILNRGK